MASERIAVSNVEPNRITMMVRNVVLSQYTSNAPDTPGRMKIAAGPLYDLAQVQALAEAMQLTLWTRKCIQNVRDLYETVRDEYSSELAMVADLLQRLGSSGRYQDSEWCDNGKNGLAACDSYEVRRSDAIAATGRRQETRYYVKFAIGKTGQLLLVVSCHL
jgi:hypothetical protein